MALKAPLSWHFMPGGGHFLALTRMLVQPTSPSGPRAQGLCSVSPSTRRATQLADLEK